MFKNQLYWAISSEATINLVERSTTKVLVKNEV
jgi:hypothetical protein